MAQHTAEETRRQHANEQVTEEVAAFYRALPFNYEQSVEETCRTIRESNQIAAAYPPLDAALRAGRGRAVLDVGCGAGWFVNTVAHHYGLDTVGVDLCEPALDRARAVSQRLGVEGKTNYHHLDIFRLETQPLTPTNRFSIVNTLGVLHSTYDCQKALRIVANLVEPTGLLHVGLYHRYGRKPFLDLFARARQEHARTTESSRRQEIEEEACQLYRTLHRTAMDPTMLRSWCRDQVFHPHETLHTVQEVYGWLTAWGFRCLATSINRFEPVQDWTALFEEEKQMEALSYQRNVRERRFFPGFFVVLAQRA